MCPPGKLRFTLIDPVGLGQNVAPFLALGDLDGRLISGGAWSESQHIEQQLNQLDRTHQYGYPKIFAQ